MTKVINTNPFLNPTLAQVAATANLVRPSMLPFLHDIEAAEKRDFSFLGQHSEAVHKAFSAAGNDQLNFGLAVLGEGKGRSTEARIVHAIKSGTAEEREAVLWAGWKIGEVVGGGMADKVLAMLD